MFFQKNLLLWLNAWSDRHAVLMGRCGGVLCSVCWILMRFSSSFTSHALSLSPISDFKKPNKLRQHMSHIYNTHVTNLGQRTSLHRPPHLNMSRGDVLHGCVKWIMQVALSTNKKPKQKTALHSSQWIYFSRIGQVKGTWKTCELKVGLLRRWELCATESRHVQVPLPAARSGCVAVIRAHAFARSTDP